MSWLSMLPFAKAQPVPTRTESRAERRRIAKNNRRAYSTCRNCGFGGVKKVPGSNLVRVLLNTDKIAYQHASPAVCGGFLRTLAVHRATTWQDWIRWNVRKLRGA